MFSGNGLQNCVCQASNRERSGLRNKHLAEHRRFIAVRSLSFSTFVLSFPQIYEQTENEPWTEFSALVPCVRLARPSSRASFWTGVCCKQPQVPLVSRDEFASRNTFLLFQVICPVERQELLARVLRQSGPLLVVGAGMGRAAVMMVCALVGSLAVEAQVYTPCQTGQFSDYTGWLTTVIYNTRAVPACCRGLMLSQTPSHIRIVVADRQAFKIASAPKCSGVSTQGSSFSRRLPGTCVLLQLQLQVHFWPCVALVVLALCPFILYDVAVLERRRHAQVCCVLLRSCIVTFWRRE